MRWLLSVPMHLAGRDSPPIDVTDSGREAGSGHETEPGGVPSNPPAVPSSMAGASSADDGSAAIVDGQQLPAALRIAVIGGGYVGLVQAAGLASLGHTVRVGERDKAKRKALRAARLPIYEPGLDALVAEGMTHGRLSFHRRNNKAVRGAQVVFIALPTPSRDNGSVDTTILDEAVEGLAGALARNAVLAIKSTVPVGTSERMAAIGAISRRGVRVVSNPEFLREGNAVKDFLEPDRIVIGATDEGASEMLASEVYGGLPGKRVFTDPASAEMIKYAANAYLASRISFVNSIANLCEEVGADAAEVLRGMGEDRRIGTHYLQPGPGYGGSCFPKDTRALVAIADQNGYDFSMLRAVMDVNSSQRDRIVGKVAAAVEGSLDGRIIGVWGLAFKAETDDIRESPAVSMVEQLRSAGSIVRAYDPKVTAAIPGVETVTDAISAVRGADVLLVATEWKEFRDVDLSEVRRVMRGAAVVDARNLLDRHAVKQNGLSYEGVGTRR